MLSPDYQALAFKRRKNSDAICDDLTQPVHMARIKCKKKRIDKETVIFLGS